jgi:predicted nucleic acid-binding protein
MSRPQGSWRFWTGLPNAGAVAPQLWPIEALNGLLTAERRGRIDRKARQRLAGFLQELPITIDDETASRSWTTTAHLAEQHRLTAYDAAYLELAMRRGLSLATSDTALIAAAKVAGLQLLPTT